MPAKGVTVPGGRISSNHNGALAEIEAIIDKCGEAMGGCENCPIPATCQRFHNRICDPSSQSEVSQANLPRLKVEFGKIHNNAMQCRIEKIRNSWDRITETRDLHSEDWEKAKALIGRVLDVVREHSWSHVFQEYDLELRLIDEYASKLPRLAKRS